MNSKKRTSIVQTTCGPVVGLLDEAESVETFLGIPYAEPPVGSLRFKPPVPKRPWNDVFDAVRFGRASLQVAFPSQTIAPFCDTVEESQQPFYGSEDCLSLNVWRPSATGVTKRPMLIWIHGGGNHLEGSRSPDYDGTKLAQLGEIVFASMNYRLGVFGFLDVGHLGGEEFLGSSCNGLRDQLMAIEWLIDNAAAFGADPDNITLAGESAGSMDISWLLASKRLKGRVKRAILMSNIKGPAGFGENPQGMSRHDHRFSQKIASDLLAQIGYADFDSLQRASGEEIYRRLGEIASSGDVIFGFDSLFYPCVGPDRFSEEPFRAVRNGALAGIDLMLGYTNYEAGLWLLADPDMLIWPAQKMADRFGNLADDVKAVVVAAYREFYPDTPEGELGLHIMSDCAFAAPITWYGEEAQRSGSKVWMYRFDWEVNERLKAMHAADIPFFFGRPNSDAAFGLVGAPANVADAAERERLAAVFTGYALSFVRHGDPNKARADQAPAWPSYETDRRTMMRLATPCSVVEDPDQARRIWWTQRVYEPMMGQPG